MPSLALKVAATLLTLAAALGATLHVGTNLRNGSATLHPVVLNPTPAASDGGRLTLTPSVRTGNAQAVTSTYVS